MTDLIKRLRSGCNDYCKTQPIFNLVNNETNLGYTKTVNKGLKLASADYVITLNSDTIIPRHLISGMLTCFGTDPDIGIVGPYLMLQVGKMCRGLIGDDGRFAINTIPFNLNTGAVQSTGQECLQSRFS